MWRARFRRGRCLWWVIALLASNVAAPNVRADQADDFFRAKVEPILVGRCLQCHADEHKGGLNLTTKVTALKGGETGPVIVPGKPERSLLVEHVTNGQMPPKKPLPKDEIAVLRQWIGDGAYFPDRTLDPFSLTTDRRAGYDWWSLRPIVKPRAPAGVGRIGNPSSQEGVTDVPPAVTPIDRFLLAKLHLARLEFSPPADRAALIRRVSYDLIGLPPTYEEVRAFTADARPDAYERLVERLLASPRYGERWARHWLDVVRFAESNGFERDRIRTTFWPYRDYVIAAFNDDKPYDQFVREQLAGDALPEGARNLVATGFLVAGPKNDVETISELEQLTTRQDELDDYVSATCTTFVGLTVGCARCHDHKFDPIRARDYYGLTAVFSGLDRGENAIGSAADKAHRDAQLASLQAKIDAGKREIERLLAAAEQRLAASSGIQVARPLPAVDVKRNEDPFEPIEARFVRFTVTATNNGSEPCLDELEVYGDDERTNLALASTGAKASASSLLPGFPIHQVHHLNDGRYGNSASWISSEPRAGWAQIELPRAAKVQRVVWGRDREGKYQDRLATAYAIEVSLDARRWTKVSDHTRRRQSSGRAFTDEQLRRAMSKAERQQLTELRSRIARLEAERKALPPPSICYSARDTQPRPSYLLKRGNVRARGEEVRPAAFSAVRALPADLHVPHQDSGPQRRLRLAEWIVDPRNPLTARVLVNRLWHYHFGVGLIDTPSDFGFNGGRPSHPELLDWLAADFVEHGWQLKRMHRQIVLSAAYRQSSRHDAVAAAKDGANRLLWRFSPRRLTAEELRDTMLSASGWLDPRMDGPSFALFDYRDGNVPDYVPRDRQGPETWRRAIYMYNIRTFQPPVVGAFDCPDPSVQTPQRPHSTTAIQALSLLNNAFTIEQAEHLARRVREIAGTRADLASVAFCLVLQREPSRDEQKMATDFSGRHGLVALCRVLLNLNEFLYVF